MTTNGSVIHDIGYKPYSGPRLNRPHIVRALYWYSLRSAFGFGRGARARVIPLVMFGITLLPAAISIYQAASSGGDPVIPYDRYAYSVFLTVVVFIATAAPELVSRDLRHHTLPLYFSRPLRRSDYPLAKLLALGTAIVLFEAIPLLIMYLGSIASATSGSAVWAQTKALAPGLLIALVYGLLLAPLTLLIASLTGRRAIVTGAIAILFLATYSISGVLESAGTHTTVTLNGARPDDRQSRKELRGNPHLRPDRPGRRLRRPAAPHRRHPDLGPARHRRKNPRPRLPRRRLRPRAPAAHRLDHRRSVPALSKGWSGVTGTNDTTLDDTGVIELLNTTHWYGNVVAVNDITMTLRPGVTGLLGPNGAGKSTLLHLIAGFLSPSRGTVTIGGASPWRNPGIFRTVGLVPERDSVYAFLTAREFVTASARLHQLPEPGAAAQRALDMVELDAAADRPIDTYSKGMRQRAKVAAALVHDPGVLLLDEPFNGMDPRQRLQMTDLLKHLGATGRIILFSSHILEEVERLADTVQVVVAGRLAASGDYRTIRRLMTNRPHVFFVRTTDDRALAKALIGSPAVEAVALTREGLEVRAGDHGTFTRQIAGLSRTAGVGLREVIPADESLESVFAYLVGA
jgi:ABC-2 type transport system ATP-binding protein